MKFKKILLGIGVLGTSGLFCLIGGEVLLRTTHYYACPISENFPSIYTHSKINNHKLLPNHFTRHCDYLGDFDVTYRTDGKGGRYTPDVPENLELPSVLLLGDSYAFGLGLEDNQTIGYALQKLGKESFRLINRGVPGYSIDQQFNQLQDLLKSEMKVCSVALQVHSSDLVDIYYHKKTAGTRSVKDPRYQVDNTHRLNTRAVKVGILKQQLRKLYFYRFLSEDVRWMLGEYAHWVGFPPKFTAVGGDQSREDWVASHPEIILKYKESARNFGALLARQKIQFNVLYIEGNDSSMNRALREIYHAVPGAQIIETKDGLQKSDYFPNDSHFSTKGAEKIAQKIYSRLPCKGIKDSIRPEDSFPLSEGGEEIRKARPAA